MKREIIKIDEDKCNGCGLCVPDCPEGALQVIDGKARLISDLFCDGLGACVGACPEGAMEVEVREAEDYDEARVMRESIIPQGPGTVRAHLEHLQEHGAGTYFDQAMTTLHEVDPAIHDVMVKMFAPGDSAEAENGEGCASGGCPGSRTMSFIHEAVGKANAGSPVSGEATAPSAEALSALTHWPVQMHLMNPSAPHYRGADFVLAADCTAFSLGGFHGKILAGKTLGIACPKLDQGLEIYRDKIRALVDQAGIDTLTVAIMQVPCCGGLLRIAMDAVESANRKIPVKKIVVGVQGEILEENWV